MKRGIEIVDRKFLSGSTAAAALGGDAMQQDAKPVAEVYFHQHFFKKGEYRYILRELFLLLHILFNFSSSSSLFHRNLPALARRRKLMQTTNKSSQMRVNRLIRKRQSPLAGA